MMEKNWFMLSKNKIIVLIIYFLLLFIIGISLTLLALLHETVTLVVPLSISLIAIIGGAGTALFGSSTFYLRKIYKACINKEMKSPICEDDKIREIGVFSYYFTRPLFAVGFSILVHIALKSSVHIVTINETRLDEGFIHLTLFLSFFSGFAAGDLITYIEERSVEWATKTFKNS